MKKGKNSHTSLLGQLKAYQRRDYTLRPDKLNSDSIREVHDSLEVNQGSKIIAGDRSKRIFRARIPF